MLWPIAILVCVAISIAMLVCLHTRRLLARFTGHLSETGMQLEERFRQRRNLVPSIIALGAGAPGLERQYLETLDNAAELLFRSKGFDERILAENRLSSALWCLRRGLRDLDGGIPSNLASLVEALDDREAAVAMATETYNRQVATFRDCFNKNPHRWTGPLCGYRSPRTIEIRLSNHPPDIIKHRPARNQQEAKP